MRYGLAFPARFCQRKRASLKGHRFLQFFRVDRSSRFCRAGELALVASPLPIQRL